MDNVAILKNKVVIVFTELSKVEKVIRDLFQFSEYIEFTSMEISEGESNLMRKCGPELTIMLETFYKLYLKHFARFLTVLDRWNSIIEEFLKSENATKIYFAFWFDNELKKLLSFLKVIEDSISSITNEMNDSLIRYKKITMFPEEYKQDYKDRFENFFNLKIYVGSTKVGIEELFKKKKEIDNYLVRTVSKRREVKLSLYDINKNLKGRIIVRVIFDYKGSKSEHIHYSSYPEDWREYFIKLVSEYNFSFEQCVSITEELFRKWLNEFIASQGALFEEIYLSDKIDVCLNVYVTDKLRNRGFESSKKILIDPSKQKFEFVYSSQGKWFIFINILKLYGLIYLLLKEDRRYIDELSGFVVHELAHVHDKRIGKWRSGDISDRLRIEGLAVFSEYVFNAKICRLNEILPTIEEYTKKKIASLSELVLINEKKENDIYWLGAFMCITIFIFNLKKKYNFNIQIFNRNELVGLIDVKDYKDFAILQIKQFRLMPTSLFLARYMEATTNLGLPPVLTQEFAEKIIKLERRDGKILKFI